MQHPPQRSWRPFAFGLGSFLLIVLAFLAVGHFANAAITIENVGGSLGLGNADLKQTIVNILKWALGLLGLVAVIVMLYGGFLWLTSRGDEKKIDKAKRVLINGAIGLVIILVSWAIVLFIQRFITNATNSAAASGQCQMRLPADWGYCNLCDDAADPRPDYGLLYPDPTCIIPESRDYYATWEDPTHEATNIKLCQAVSAGFGGLIQTAPNPPFENDILDPGSDFAVYRCNDSGSGPNCADRVEVNGTPRFTNNVASLNPAEDYMPNSKYYVDVSQVRSVATGNPAASRPIPPDGWTFLTGTENDEDPPGVLQICSQLRCSNDPTSRCTTDVDCGTGNFCRPLRCQTNAQCGGTETCNPMTAPANGETIQCLSPIIEVQFTEGMYPPSAMNPANMVITRTDGQPTTVGIARIDMPTRDIIQVTLNQPLVKNVTYRVTLSAENGADDTKGYRDTCSNALDCGNGLGQCTQSGMPTQGTPADDYRFDFTTADTDTVDCTPIVTGITSPSLHGNSTNQNRVTITGTNFGLAAGKQVRFSGNILATETSGAPSQCFANNNLAEQSASPACIRTSGSNQIQTIVPTGSNQFSPTGAIDGGVVVIKGTQESPLSSVTTDIQSPHISGIYPREGKAGRFVTITGDNFGGSGRVRFRNDDGSVSVNADIPSCVPNGWTNTEIIVQVPEGFAENTATHIQVCGKGDAGCAGVANISNTSRFDYKNIDGPNLCGMRPVGSTGAYEKPFGSNTPDAPMEVLGDGFGTNLGVVDVRYSAIDGSAEAPFDEKHLVARPSGALPNGSYNFFVTVDGRASNHITYTIPKDPPPQVVQDASCNVGNTPPIMPSPNVYPDSTGVCRNISLEARFTQVMNPATLTPQANVVVQRCNQNDVFSDATCTTTVDGVRLPVPVVNPTAVRFTPNAVLEDGYWYKVTITSAVQSDAGVAMPVPYTWKFRVRASGGDCALDAIVVNPARIGPLSTTQQALFEAVPSNASCALLTNIPGAFTWAVTANPALVALGVPTTNPVTAEPASNNVVATVQAGSANGTATIQASHSGKAGSGDLIVQRNYCETNTDCATRTNSYGATCTGAVCNVAQRTCEPLILDLQSGTQTGKNVSGPIANLINVRGCYFGPGLGAISKVNFTNNGSSYKGSFAICGPAGWTNDVIRVQTMPDTDPPASQNTDWGVQVFADNGAPGQCSNNGSPCRADATCTGGGVCNSTLQSNTDASYQIVSVCSKPDGGTTGVPNSGVPILCNISQPAGREGDTITYGGDKFVAGAGNTEAFFTQATDTATQIQNLGTPTTIAAPRNLTSHVPGLTAIPQSATYARTTVGVLESPGNYCIATPIRFDVSCNLNSECSTGCCAAQICSQLTTCTDGMILSINPPAGALSCRNTAFIVTFDRDMLASSLNSTTIKLRLTSGNVEVSSLSISGRQVTITPSTPLDPGNYQVAILGGSTGVVTTTNRYMSGNWTSGTYTVGAGATICKIASTTITPATDIYTCSGDTCGAEDRSPLSGNQHSYAVNAYDVNSIPLTLQSQTWTQGDSSSTNSTSNVYDQALAGGTCPGNATSSTYCGQSTNVPNGSESLTVDVVGTSGSGTGTASMNVRSFLCAKPWPAAGSFPFRDPAFGAVQSHNFTFAFCRDSVSDASLMPMPPAAGIGDVKKEYFMFVEDKNNARTGDAIGIRILGNTALGWYSADLSPKRWYRKTFGKESTGTTLEVDGYPALREGRTVYVTADVVRAGNRPATSPAVYVISHNDNAKPETVAIFDQILKNIRFNADVPALDESLKADIRNDVKRIHALYEFVYGLADYYKVHTANPSLETGTFLKYWSFSSWPSWQQELGQTLGITMPRDPEVKWNPSATLCGDKFDTTTCWNQTTKVMEFPSQGVVPADSTGIAYQYIPGIPGTPPTPPSVNLYATGSSHFWSHIVPTFTVHAPTTNICPAGNSCLGFNVSINSSNFGTMSDWRLPSALDKTAPLVAIESPQASPPGPALAGAVTFVMTASDETGGSGMQRVDAQIMRGTTTVASTTLGAPDKDGKYRWTWNSRPVLNGAYILSVTATDRSGNISPAATRSYTVTNPPGDSEPPIITASAQPSQWDGTTSVAVSASATDQHTLPVNNTGVAKIEFYLGSSKLGEGLNATCPTCSTTYSTIVTVPATTIQGFPNGLYTYSVVAYDGFGNTSVKNAQVTIGKSTGDSAPPSVVIIQPTGTVSGANTDVVANASDASGIDRVEFSIDGAFRVADFSGPYSFSWLLTGYGNNSPHTILAVAYDIYGNQATATQDVTYTIVTESDTQRPVISDVTATLDTGTKVAMDGAQLKNTVTLNATLTDNVAMLKAELRIDGIKIPLIGNAYTCPSPPQVCTLAYPWDTLPEIVGQHTVSITAYDTSNYATTVTQTVNVVNEVIMSISSPPNDSTVKDAPTGTCALTQSRTCTTSSNCPVSVPGRCKFHPAVTCDSFDECALGELCIGVIHEACNTGPAGVPVVIDVTRTCSTGSDALILSSVQFFLDGTPLPGSATCTYGRCTYTWNSKATSSNGSHTLTAIGQDKIPACKGGAKATVVVNNTVTDTTPPTITSFNYRGVNWTGGSAAYVNVVNGDITLTALDNNSGSGLAQLLITVKNSSGTTLQTQDCGAVTLCQLLTWNPPDGGNYTVTAHVEDASGNAPQDIVQVVNVDTIAPTGRWLAPADGSTVNSPPDVTLSADASDPTAPSGYASGIASVLFSENGAQWFDLPTQSGTTWSLIEPLAAGMNSYNIEITDRAGNVFIPTPDITLTVVGQDTRAPWVLIDSPTDGYISGTFTPIARAGDWGGTGVRDVQFYLGGTAYGPPDATSPYNSPSIDTTTMPGMTQGSSHTLYAVACDKATPTNNCTTSGTVTFLVNNTGGANCGPYICSGATSFCCGGPPYVCQDPNSACSYSGGGGG